jgi:hypothetical protein
MDLKVVWHDDMDGENPSAKGRLPSALLILKSGMFIPNVTVYFIFQSLFWS